MDCSLYLSFAFSLIKEMDNKWIGISNSFIFKGMDIAFYYRSVQETNVSKPMIQQCIPTGCFQSAEQLLKLKWIPGQVSIWFPTESQHRHSAHNNNK